MDSRARSKKYYQEHKEIWRDAYARLKADPVAHQAKKDYNRARITELHKHYKRLAFEKLGGVCKHCGFSDWRALQIDHVDAGGCAERKKKGPKNKQGYTFYRRVFEAPEGVYQLLCANCNWIKAYENGERPGTEFPVEHLQENKGMPN